MKRTLLFLTLLIIAIHINAQNRIVARGAESGELYLTGFWYGIYAPPGPPFYDTLRNAIFRLAENGKKLTIQYNEDSFANPEDIMLPFYINADATPGVLYNSQHYSKNSYPHTALWVSFDHGENWIFREENIGSHHYFTPNFEGVINRGKLKSNDYGETFFSVEGGVGTQGEFGWTEEEVFSVGTYNTYDGMLYHTYDLFITYATIPIDSQCMCCQIWGIFPDVYRGGKEGEVYISSLFPDPNYDVTYKVSFSADTGYTFRHVFVSESYDDMYGIPQFMSDREPGVFYIIRRYEVKETKPPYGWHTKVCIDYYRDYGETLEATFCHDIIKNYEYEEVNCEHTTNLEATVLNQNAIQLQWSNSADNIRGYHVYRGNVRITNYELRENTYLDENLPIGEYEYYVRTYYNEGCVSDSSNHVAESVELGVKGVKELEGVRLFPNPTSGEFTINNEQLTMNNVEVFDVYGRKLSSHHLIISSSHHKINISHLQAGIYFIKITTEKGIIIKKVVKM
jgi:hypothetical protein